MPIPAKEVSFQKPRWQHVGPRALQGDPPWLPLSGLAQAPRQRGAHVCSHLASVLLMLSFSLLVKQKALCKTNPAMPPSLHFLTCLAPFFKEFGLLRSDGGVHHALEHVGAPGLELAVLQPVQQSPHFPSSSSSGFLQGHHFGQWFLVL